MAGLGHMKGELETTVVHFANSVDSTSKKLHIVPPRTIGNWCVTGRTVGDRRTPKVLQGLESNPPSGRSSRNGEAANVNEGDLPHWMVRNASSVMLIGTDATNATNALGRQNQHERPSSAHSGRLRTASSSHSRRPATATARQRLPVPGSEQPAAADACARSSKYSQWSRPASASASPSPSQRGIVSTAHKFLTSDAPERPVSREGGRLSRPSTAQSRLGATSRSNQDRNHGEKSSTTLNKSDRNALAAEHSERMKKGYGMSLLIPAMLSADDTQRVSSPGEIIMRMSQHGDWLAEAEDLVATKAADSPLVIASGDAAGQERYEEMSLVKQTGAAWNKRPQSGHVARRIGDGAGGGGVSLIVEAKREARVARRVLAEKMGISSSADSLAMSMHMWKSFNSMRPNAQRRITMERFRQIQDQLAPALRRSLEKGFASKGCEMGLGFDRFVACAAPFYRAGKLLPARR